MDCWYVPASQSSHAIEFVDGCAEPPAHSVQLLWPDSSLYLPTSHSLQDDAPDPLGGPLGRLRAESSICVE